VLQADTDSYSRKRKHKQHAPTCEQLQTETTCIAEAKETCPPALHGSSNCWPSTPNPVCLQQRNAVCPNAHPINRPSPQHKQHVAQAPHGTWALMPLLFMDRRPFMMFMLRS
jgi:hypothetical protein